MGRTALVTWGGWEGHAPKAMAAAAEAWLRDDGFEVRVSDDLDVYAEASMCDVDVVVQAVTMGDLTPSQEDGLLSAVAAGTGIAGWHGGLCDSFRSSSAYQFMVGGQWVAHPGGADTTYRVDIAPSAHPITDGVAGFELTGEQYYLHVDPSNVVLATTMFAGTDDEPWTRGVVMPVAWTRTWGAGRVFYASFGHAVDELAVPEVATILRRGMAWASR